MKKIYIKKLLSTLSLMVCVIAFSQAQVDRTSEVVFYDQPVCTYPTSGVDMGLFIERSAAVKRAMDADEPAVCAGATFNVIYTSGFNAFPEAQAAYEYATQIWGAILDTDITITVQANFNSASANNLGSAFSPVRFFASSTPSAGDPVYASALGEYLRNQEIFYFNSITNQFSSLDIISNFNSNRTDWFFGIPGDGTSIAPGQIDFITVVLHEIGHGLGFFGHGRVSGGEGSIGTTIPIQDPNGSGTTAPHIWDTFIEGFDSDVSNFVDVLSLPNPSTKLFDLFTSTGTGLRSNSPTALLVNTDLNFGVPTDGIPVFAPTSFISGSSYSHLDTPSYNGTENALMVHQLPSFSIIHDPGPVALGFMKDMGWKLCPAFDPDLSNDEFVLDEIRISPNPFTESITLTLPSGLSSDSFNVTLIDINGRVVLNETPVLTNNELTISNLSSLEASLYFLKIESTTSNVSITKKIVKN